ncbi:hypothetical protein AAMO2058_001678900 [Amorphochlora amoebiformis]|mmetsp:Transcript_2664/g.3916  ORF Transcript_2664/g.3916 Transcript_2664/m.3916 type:complete len:175 (-) Transcript_2664:186-710(-)
MSATSLRIGVIQSLEHAVDVTDDLTIDCIYRLQIHYNCLEVKAYTTMTKCHQLAIAAQRLIQTRVSNRYHAIVCIGCEVKDSQVINSYDTMCNYSVVTALNDVAEKENTPIIPGIIGNTTLADAKAAAAAKETEGGWYFADEAVKMGLVQLNQAPVSAPSMAETTTKPLILSNL